MANISIKDLADNVELDRQAMQSIIGGSTRSGFIRKRHSAELLWGKKTQKTNLVRPFADLSEAP